METPRISQIYNAAKFTKADREIEDLEGYRGRFEEVVLTFSLHREATTHATTVAEETLHAEYIFITLLILYLTHQQLFQVNYH